MLRRTPVELALLLFPPVMMACASSRRCPEVPAAVPVCVNGDGDATASFDARDDPPRDDPWSLCRDLAQLEGSWQAVRRIRGDVVILAYQATFPAPDDVVAKVSALGSVSAAERFVVFEAHVMGVRRWLTLPVQGRGRVFLAETAAFVLRGELSELERDSPTPALALGLDLGAQLGVSVGDYVGLVPLSSNEEAEVAPVRARVAALLSLPGGAATAFESNELVLSEAAASRLWNATAGAGASPTGIVVKLRAGQDAAAAAKAIRLALQDPGYRVMTQDELNVGAKRTAKMLRAWCKTAS